MDTTAGETTLVLSGPVTLAEVPRWRDAILAALGDGRLVWLDLAKTGPWDPAGLQLVVSAVNGARRGSSPIRLDNVPRVFLAIAEQAGVTDWLGEAINGR